MFWYFYVKLCYKLRLAILVDISAFPLKILHLSAGYRNLMMTIIVSIWNQKKKIISHIVYKKIQKR